MRVTSGIGFPSIYNRSSFRPESSIWRFVAIKIFSARSTLETNAGHLHELATLQVANRLDAPLSLPRLLDHFEITGPHGHHICLVLEYAGHTLSAFRSSTPTKTLRLHVVQLAALYVAAGLQKLHEAGIIHTGASCWSLLNVFLPFPSLIGSRRSARQHPYS